ncbi:hypothetical protein GCM10028818_33080 [Spirosoma horti]
MLLEAMTDADHIQLSMDELELELLSGDFGVSVTDIHSLIQLAEKISLFVRNEVGFLICPDLNKGLEQVFEKRNRSRLVALEAKEKVTATETDIPVTETTQSKVKESKVKDTKVSNKPDTTEFNRFWDQYGKKTGSKPAAMREWNKLARPDQQAAYDGIDRYQAYQPDSQYRKDPERYLKHKLWESEFEVAPRPTGQIPTASYVPIQPQTSSTANKPYRELV